MKYLPYTGIGSRQTNSETLQAMEFLAAELAQNYYSLRSGGAPGADQAFEMGAAIRPETPYAIYLPWSNFEAKTREDFRHEEMEYVIGNNLDDLSFPSSDVEGGRISASKLNPDYTASQIAADYHPQWKYLSRAVKKFHTRNVYQVLGAFLDTPSKFVICWTKDGKQGGGTGQALRIATAYKVPIYDLALMSVQEVRDEIGI